jgi:hypothetical protein
MILLRQPVRRSLGEGGSYAGQALRPSVVLCRDVSAAWREAWPLLERAATRTNGGTEEEVWQTLLRGDAQLWSIFDSEEGSPSVAPQERRRGAVTTQITLIGEKGCRLWLVGGSRLAEWAGDFMAEVEPWACSLGCTHVWGTQSRPGWQRIVRLFGGEPVIVDGQASWMRRF